MRLISKALLSFALCGMMLAVGAGAAAQDKSQTPAPPSSCSRDNALEIIEQQIGATRTFDNAVQRITVLVHAADLLWAFQQKKARAAFTEAFDLAVQNFKDKGYELMRGGKTMMISLPDQRYTVIGAIAKHDVAWAKKLTDQLLKEERQEAEEKPTKDNQRDRRTAEELLSMAISLLPSDEPAALNFARQSLRYPATYYLSQFLYELAGIDQPAANQFYQEALAAYRKRAHGAIPLSVVVFVWQRSRSRRDARLCDLPGSRQVCAKFETAKDVRANNPAARARVRR
jgi:hypothetical protein